MVENTDGQDWRILLPWYPKILPSCQSAFFSEGKSHVTRTALFGFLLVILLLTACTSGFPPALPGSQSTPAATHVPVPASPVPGGSPSGALTSPPLPQQEQTVTLTFAAGEYALPAY